MENIIDSLIPLGMCVILPICIIWMIYWHKTTMEKQRKEMFLAMLEKNPNMDAKSFFKMMGKTGKTIKMRLLSQLQWGCTFTFIGIMLLVLYFIGRATDDGYVTPSSINIGPGILPVCGIFMAIGLAFLFTFFVGKRMLAKEIEAETANLTKTEE